MAKKLVILAGGLGTRLAEETEVIPKPLVNIGGYPILWHIMKSYACYGVNEFVVCLGYKGQLIKEYFFNYSLYNSDVTLDLARNSMEVHSARAENWKITLVDTGITTQTGGRLKRIAPYIGDSNFFMTYGDGLSDIEIDALESFHNSHGRLATISAVRPPGRFGALDIKADKVQSFLEKPTGDGGWINGGFFVLSPEVFNYIEGDQTVWEQEPLMNLSRDGELMAFSHSGFWQPMDTLREKRLLQQLWDDEKAPWRKW